MSIKKPAKPIVLALTLVALAALISLILSIPVWRDDAEARRNKAVVYELVSVGQNLSEAQVKLKNAGFKLVYDEPITPTISEDFLSQLVVVGNNIPNAFETFGYVVNASWMPFTHSESPYVKIRAELDGTITRVD